MSAPALAGVDRPSLRIRGTPYPVLLPTLRDPRLHLAAVIVSLQVLGQVAFDFRLSIAQILVALLTCAVLEVGIAFRRQRVILWPASALLTGNGVAFILRVPGTEHGDWWSMRGWWIFAGTAAVSLLSKYLIRFRGRHVFNPSNVGLVLCFLILGRHRAEPLDFWWGPLSPALALALAIIVAGGVAILMRLRLLHIAVGFWLAFAAGIGVLAASGHAMTARWHLGPITGWEFWWVLVTSPEILVFLFFMITDPRTVPDGRAGRRAYAIGVGLLATLLIAPLTTEYATKVAVLSALAVVCAARPLLVWLSSVTAASGDSDVAPAARLIRVDGLGVGPARRAVMGAAALAGAVAFTGLLVLVGIPGRSSAGEPSAPVRTTTGLPVVTVVPGKGVAAQIDRRTSLQMARDVVSDLRVEADALHRRDLGRAAAGADGAWLAELWRRIRGSAGQSLTVPVYGVERIRVTLEPGKFQDPPTVVATLAGMVEVSTYAGSPPALEQREDPVRFQRTVELALQRGRYLIVATRSVTGVPRSAVAPASPSPNAADSDVLGGVRLHDVARQVGLDFRQGSFGAGVTNDMTAMMGGGLCWLDYDGDGWLDLFVVNSYSDGDYGLAQTQGGLPRSALYHNVRGRFVDVSRGAGADLPVRGNGCVAADLNLDGHTDLYVTTAGYNVETDGYDALLWNNGDGTFTDGARAAGIKPVGWHAGAAVGDVNGDSLPDLFVAGYTDPNGLTPGSRAGFPTNHLAVRDRLYLNEGQDGRGRSTFREVARKAGIEANRVDHGLGAVLTDVTGDGRLDLYVANDADPNRLYENVPWPGGAAGDPAGLGFRFADRARREGVADPHAGMGIAAADYSADGHLDLLVTNSRGELHALFRSQPPGVTGSSFTDARSGLASAFGPSLTGWGASWVDLDLDGRLDLVLANGAIPVTSLAKDARPIQVLQNGGAGNFTDVGRRLGLRARPLVDGRGLAAADFDNDGDVDIAVNSIGGRLILLRNTGAAGHWLEVALDGFAPGARVTAVLPDGRRFVHEVQAGSSYLSSEDPRVHFGLGRATRVRELSVRFPDGRMTRLRGVSADQLVHIAP